VFALKYEFRLAPPHPVMNIMRDSIHYDQYYELEHICQPDHIIESESLVQQHLPFLHSCFTTIDEDIINELHDVVIFDPAISTKLSLGAAPGKYVSFQRLLSSKHARNNINFPYIEAIIQRGGEARLWTALVRLVKVVDAMWLVHRLKSLMQLPDELGGRPVRDMPKLAYSLEVDSESDLLKELENLVHVGDADEEGDEMSDWEEREFNSY